MTNIGVKRYSVMRNFIAHSVGTIIKHCIKNKIGNIVSGDWEDMKRGSRIRKKIAQQFQQIPYGKYQDEYIK